MGQSKCSQWGLKKSGVLYNEKISIEQFNHNIFSPIEIYGLYILLKKMPDTRKERLVIVLDKGRKNRSKTGPSITT